MSHFFYQQISTVFCSAWLPVSSKELAAASSGLGQVADCAAPGSRRPSRLRSAHADRSCAVVRPCQRAQAHCCPRHNLWQGRAASPNTGEGTWLLCSCGAGEFRGRRVKRFGSTIKPDGPEQFENMIFKKTLSLA